MPRSSYSFPLFLFLIFLVAVLFSLFPVRPTRAEPRCFPAVPAISHCIEGRFRTFWEQHGGLPIFGYPLTPAYEEQSEAGTITVQMFERVRMEHHPQNQPPYDVLLTQFGRRQLSSRAPPPAGEQPRQGCFYVAETGYNICPPFLQFWQSHGLEFGHPGVSREESLALFGLPLTPARPEVLSDGNTYTVQWFERARLEDHGPDGVLVGLMGREAAGNRPTPSHADTAPTAPTAHWDNPYDVPQEPGGFIEVSGADLVRMGQPIRLKGVNYYPQWRPWNAMWNKWSGEQMEHELRLAREQLGINAVRILLPYGVSGDGVVDNKIIRRLREICDIAGKLDMRLIITLFDFYNTFPPPGSNTERDNIEYLETLIGNFRGDDRIMAWDLHNEPDHYPKWEQGDEDAVLMWLGRMADTIHRLAPNHLVTVGMANYYNLWREGPDGRRVIDYSDFISYHNYNAADNARQIGEIRARTDKPIVLGEFGWPSGPPCSTPGYNETRQEAVYREMLTTAEGHVAGVVAWTLRDYDAGPTPRWDTREEYYGLFRPDSSLKPAALVFRTFPAYPLPSVTRVDYRPYPSNIRDLKGPGAPELIEETGHYVKSWFRRAWDELGGRGSLGLPLSEAFVRPEDGTVVQYFEAAVLEFDDEATEQTGFYQLPIQEQTMRAIQPRYLGYEYTAGREFSPPGPRSENTRYFPGTGYSVSTRFWPAYENLLGPWRLGAAISSEMTEDLGSGPTQVQYFEKGRLEYHTQQNAAYPGQLGRWAWEQRCQAMR